MDHDVLTDPICDWHFEDHGHGSSTATILVTLYGAEGTRATLRFTNPDIAGYVGQDLLDACMSLLSARILDDPVDDPAMEPDLTVADVLLDSGESRSGPSDEPRDG